MQTRLYVGLSAQLALQRRLDTIANNVANQTTPGFRAEEVSFATLISRSSSEPVSFVSRGENFLSMKSGPITRTGRTLDVAIRGDAWLATSSADGPVYTKDGRLEMAATGALRSITGAPILDAGGANIQLDPDAGPPLIGADGTISQNGRRVGALGLFSFPPDAKLTRVAGSSSVTSDRPAIAQLDFTRVGVEQGYLEGSNVSPISEIARLIAVQRTFDAVSASLTDIENSQQEAIRGLSGN
jgi:flagellar basal-body rod protein FlgF